MFIRKRSLRLAVVLLTVALALSGCVATGSPAATGTAPQSTAPAQTATSAPTQEPAATADSAPTEPAATPQPTPEATEAVSTPEQPVETSEAGAAPAVDPADMLTITEEDDKTTYTFHHLPQNAEEMQGLWELHPSGARYTAALFVAAIKRYEESPDDCLAMLDVLRGPQPLSPTEQSFLKSQFNEKPHVPDSYFEGSSPQNNYTPTEPYTVIVRDEAATPPDGYGYAQVTSTGADSPRRLVTRIKDGVYYLWEYNGFLMSIRLPASQDPWA